MSPGFTRSTRACVVAVAVLALLGAAAPTWAGSAQSKTRRAGRTVKGTVLDLDSGQALAGYRIYVRVTEPGTEGRTSTRVLVADSAGRFKISVPNGSTLQPIWLPTTQTPEHTYVVDTEWLARSTPPVTVVRADISNLKLRIKHVRQRSVTVRVTGPDAKPVPGARIVVGGYAEPQVTGANGARNVDITRKSGPTEILVASRDGKLSTCVEVPTDAREISIRLRSSEALKGKVVGSDGRPAAGLMLSVAPVVNGEPAYMVSMDAPVVTGQDGTFTVKQGEASRYYVSWAGGGAYKQGTVILARKGEALETATAQVRNLNGPSYAGSLGRSAKTRSQELTNFCLDGDGNVLLCDGPGQAVRKVSQDDKLLGKWELGFTPEAIDVAANGHVLVGGAGVVAELDGGKVVQRGTLPGKRTVASLTHSGGDVFVCTDAASGYAVYRLNDQLKQPKRIITGLSGCCGQMDVEAHNGAVYVAENGRFSVDKYDRDGKRLIRMTKSNPKAADYYGEGCCEPKNIIFGPDGNLYAASSGKMMVKRYSPTGKFLGNAGRVSDPDGGCVRVTIALTRDGKKLYMLDTDSNVVRLLKLSPPKQ